ncbi:hypothetical protein GYMLUDRAFT_244723 [Collybiopsis luxurians FD-317 M1]|uniref:CRAL-TRIO domain-containing protein n=1 Tax=Collybiopsis luxurians FD-317 M1 TaxID=944289 RepID=A0A0D0CMR5_9AGAR|nr:hypothetical protein GYMLUDRAFT_244723 [Collybiopsis luxurians FD-317 M1]
MSNLEAPAQASASAMPQGVTDPNYKPLPVRLGNLTVPLQHALDKFKKELQEEGVFVKDRIDDATLLLNFDFPEKEEVDKYYLQFYRKMDKDGCPIYIEQLGKLDFKALYACTTQDRLLKHLIWEYEKFITSRLPACSAAVGHPVETSCTILDLKDVSLQFLSYQRLRHGRLIHRPRPGVWTVIKPWLDEVTVAKIAILGKDYKDTLLAQIPKENLPKELGGGCTCGKGCSLSDEGPWNEAKWQKIEAEMSNGSAKTV